MLRGVDKIILQPVAKRNANGVEPIALHLVQIARGDPGPVMFLESVIGVTLAQVHDTVKLGRMIAGVAANLLPLVVVNPWLKDEHCADVDSADLALGQPGMGQGGQAGRGRCQCSFLDHDFGWKSVIEGAAKDFTVRYLKSASQSLR